MAYTLCKFHGVDGYPFFVNPDYVIVIADHRGRTQMETAGVEAVRVIGETVAEAVAIWDRSNGGGAAMSSLAPLSQSKQATMACERSYVAIHVDGRGTSASAASDRGNEVHALMSEYIDHCTAKRVPADWEAFTRIARKAKAEAGGILDGLRDSYEVRWRNVYDTEVTLMLDEEFCTTQTISDTHWPQHVARRKFFETPTLSGKPAAYTMTADVILISTDGKRAVIEDFKTHPSPFEADTFQGKLGAFALMKHHAGLERVTFELVFARYQNCRRSAVYTREDMPQLQQEIARARALQQSLHAAPETAKATPCTQCAYCPLGVLTLECPIREFNPHLSVNLEDRLIFKEWTRRMNTDNTPILKAHAEVAGTVSYRDGHGKLYEFGNIPVPSTTYPLDRTTVRVLDDWCAATGEDLLGGTLNISSTRIKPLLKAKKRAALRETFEESIVQTETKPRWAVRCPEGITEEFTPYQEGE